MAKEIIEQELNRLYITDKDKYKEECDDWKSKGYKIYRDTKGRHMIVEPIKEQDTYEQFYNTLYGKDFADIFGDIFGGKY